MKAQALTEITELKGRVAAAAAKVGAAFKRWEAQGVDPDELKFAYAEAKFTEAEAAQRIRGRLEMLVATHVVNLANAEWAASVQQADLDLTPATGDAADGVVYARAKRAGTAAGRKGHSLGSNPHHARPESPEYVGWRDGHADGLELRKLMKPGSENVTHASTSTDRAEPPPPANDDPDALEDAVRAGLAALGPEAAE